MLKREPMLNSPISHHPSHLLMTCKNIFRSFFVDDPECFVDLKKEMYWGRSRCFWFGAVEGAPDGGEIEIGTWKASASIGAPSSCAQRHERQARTRHQAFLRRGDRDVDIPAVEADRGATQ